MANLFNEKYQSHFPKEILELARKGNCLLDVAVDWEVTRKTMYNWAQEENAEKHPGFRAAYFYAKEIMQLHWLKKMKKYSVTDRHTVVNEKLMLNVAWGLGINSSPVSQLPDKFASITNEIKAMEEVQAQYTAGSIDIDQALKMSQFIKTKSDIRKTDDMDKRLMAVEEEQNLRKKQKPVNIIPEFLLKQDISDES